MAYVEGVVIPIAKKNLPAYWKMARKCAKIWLELGALEDRLLDRAPQRHEDGEAPRCLHDPTVSRRSSTPVRSPTIPTARP